MECQAVIVMFIHQLFEIGNGDRRLFGVQFGINLPKLLNLDDDFVGQSVRIGWGGGVRKRTATEKERESVPEKKVFFSYDHSFSR